MPPAGVVAEAEKEAERSRACPPLPHPPPPGLVWAGLKPLRLAGLSVTLGPPLPAALCPPASRPSATAI